MRKFLFYTTFYAAFLLVGCAVTGGLLGSSPEAQIFNGANGVTAAATLATTALKNNAITVAQAKGYQGFLTTASGHLDSANVALLACRKKTSSTSKSNPDPCAAGIEADIRLAVDIAAQVSNTIKGAK